MIVTLQNLIEALRNELQQYGEMLALLDQQREMVRLQGADQVLPSLSAIDAQSAAIQAARVRRESAQQAHAHQLHQPSDSTFARIIPLLPEQYRPLVSALVQENNELLLRVRDRAQQNHILLRQSVEMMQRFITTLAPDNSTESCELAVAETGPALYEAII